MGSSQAAFWTYSRGGAALQNHFPRRVVVVPTNIRPPEHSQSSHSFPASLLGLRPAEYSAGGNIVVRTQPNVHPTFAVPRTPRLLGRRFALRWPRQDR